MKVSIWIEEKDDYAEVNVPLFEISRVIAKHYGISAEAMLKIINDFNIDLEEEIDNNDNIKEFARELYYKNKEVE